MENEFGEELTDDEIEKIVERILKLSNGFIDEFFYRCGLIYQDCELKALDKENIEEIREKEGDSDFFLTLIAETPKKDILGNLEEIEEELQID